MGPRQPIARRRVAAGLAWLLVLGWLAVVLRELPATAEVRLNDFEGYWSAAQVVLAGEPERLYDADRKWFTNLPVLAWLFAPLGALEYANAWKLFWAIQLASFAATIGVVWLTIARHYGPLTPLRAAGSLALLLCFAPVLLRCLSLGQSTPSVVLLLALFQLAVREGWRKLGGALLGLACLIKIPPLLLVLGLGLRRRIDVAGAALAVVGVGIALSLAAFGPELVGQYAQRVVMDNAGQAQAAFNNRSLDGAYMRMLTDRSLVDWDPLRRPASVAFAVAATLSALIAWLAWRGGLALVWPRTPPGPEPLELELAIGAALMVLAFPVVWIHYYLFLAVPFALLPFWWAARGLPLTAPNALVLAVGLWLASGSEVHPNHVYGRHQFELGFRWLQNLQPLGAVLLAAGLAAPLSAWVGRPPAHTER